MNDVKASQTLVIGDAASTLKTLPEASVQLVVTSPPYWSIKDYGHPNQIGHRDSYEEYLQRLAAVWSECARVLEPGCKIAINIGDQFLRARDHGTYRIQPIHADIIQQFREIEGFIYLGGIIWRKVTTTNPTGGCAWMGSIYYPRDGYVTYEHEFILLFKRSGKAKRPKKELLDRSKLTKEQRSAWFRGVWDLPPERQKEHPAAFPVELPERLIRMFTFQGETVLDPFVGSGTTLLAARRAGRNGIGVELNPAFGSLCATRVPAVSTLVCPTPSGQKTLRQENT
jgi:modification methylase